MRKIEEKICYSVANKIKMGSGDARDTVRIGNKFLMVALWQNAIILRQNGDFYFTFAGWMTNTTKSRINNILHYFIPSFSGVSQKNFELYYKNEKIDVSAVYLVKQDGMIEKTKFSNLWNVR